MSIAQSNTPNEKKSHQTIETGLDNQDISTTRVYLPVEPDKTVRKNKTASGLIVLSPPPLDLPYGIGYSFGGKGDPEDYLRAWVRQKNEKGAIPLAKTPMMYVTPNYMEPSIGLLEILPVCLLLQLLAFTAYLVGFWGIFEPFISSLVAFAIGHIAILSTFAFFLYNVIVLIKCPVTICFNRLRQEIYCYDRSGELIIIPFTSARFVLVIEKNTAAYLCVENYGQTSFEFPYMMLAAVITGSKDASKAADINILLKEWQTIDHFMRSEDGYKDIPLSSFEFFGLRSRKIIPFLVRDFQKTHRWAPEIEALLWEENKDAPLPNGWQYMKRIPYKIPWGGFDNTKLLEEREKRLQQKAS
ncbi:hypothetical protein [Desulfovibrio litoralis]|uniref:Uncharacterized protein n=1 Tax=Desulfovibrio litoralis DSM 11393 TaxID=1121455 RepID=A0A1M7SN36_9BACT|nr:hypothetical protein [Desulfovibrio litoralis]SHN59877.1 hypothetical protein SAMN02745728_01062 [Desulfovibrio litoralis DSM 11393]